MTDGRATQGAERLARAFAGEFPDSAARVLEGYPVTDATTLLRRTPAAELAVLVSRMNPGYAARYASGLSITRVAELIRRLDRVDAAALLRMLPARRRNAILDRLPQRFAVPLQWLLRHPEHAVGAWIDADALTLSIDLTAGEALARLRENACGDDSVYVLDRDRRLCGVASVAALLNADASAGVAAMMAPPPAPLLSQAPLATAAGAAAWQRHGALPVVDWRQRFVGVLRSDELERGLQRGIEPPPHVSLTDSLLEAGEAYWLGMAGVLRATLALLTEPAARVDKGKSE